MLVRLASHRSARLCFLVRLLDVFRSFVVPLQCLAKLFNVIETLIPVFFLSLAVQGCCDSNLSILFVTLDDDIQILIVIVTMNRPVSRARSMVGGPLTFRCYGAAIFADGNPCCSACLCLGGTVARESLCRTERDR